MSNTTKPRPSQELFEERRRLEMNTSYSDPNLDRLIELVENYNWDAEITESNGKYGLKNWQGKQLLPEEFDNFKLLSSHILDVGDLVVIVLENMEGIIRIEENNSYSWILQPIYDYISYPNRLISVMLDGKWGVIDLNKNEFILPLEFDYISNNNGFLFVNDISTFTKESKIGILNSSGSKTEAIFDEIENEFDGYVRARINDKWGYIKEDGSLTEDMDEAFYFYNID